MNQRSLATLIAINAVLMAALVVTVFNPAPARAQFAAGNQYLMIAGLAPQRSDQSVTYIVDMRTSRMIVALYSSANQNLEFITGRIVSEDIKAAPTGRR